MKNTFCYRFVKHFFIQCALLSLFGVLAVGIGYAVNWLFETTVGSGWLGVVVLGLVTVACYAWGKARGEK